MLDKGYMLLVNKKLMITNQIYREIDPNSLVLSSPSKKTKITFKELFMKFLKEDAKVPYQLPFSYGRKYTVGQYSKGAEKAFIAAYKTPGVIYEDLVEATKRYYSSSVSNKVTIKRYFEDGIWEGELDNFIRMRDKGEVLPGNETNIRDL